MASQNLADVVEYFTQKFANFFEQSDTLEVVIFKTIVVVNAYSILYNDKLQHMDMMQNMMESVKDSIKRVQSCFTIEAIQKMTFRRVGKLAEVMELLYNSSMSPTVAKLLIETTNCDFLKFVHQLFNWNPSKLNSPENSFDDKDAMQVKIAHFLMDFCRCRNDSNIHETQVNVALDMLNGQNYNLTRDFDLVSSIIQSFLQNEPGYFPEYV